MAKKTTYNYVAPNAEDQQDKEDKNLRFMACQIVWGNHKPALLNPKILEYTKAVYEFLKTGKNGVVSE